jgi:hypothetical protein
MCAHESGHVIRHLSGIYAHRAEGGENLVPRG